MARQEQGFDSEALLKQEIFNNNRMAKFVKGQSGNPKGRPKSEQKNNEELRRMIREFISGNIGIEEMQKDFDKIEKPELKFKIRLDLLKMLIPDPISLQKLSPEEMEEFFNYVKSELNYEKS